MAEKNIQSDPKPPAGAQKPDRANDNDPVKNTGKNPADPTQTPAPAKAPSSK